MDCYPDKWSLLPIVGLYYYCRNSYIATPRKVIIHSEENNNENNKKL